MRSGGIGCSIHVGRRPGRGLRDGQRRARRTGLGADARRLHRRRRRAAAGDSGVFGRRVPVGAGGRHRSQLQHGASGAAARGQRPFGASWARCVLRIRRCSSVSAARTEVLAPLSRDRAPAIAALDHLDPWGTTPLYDATLSAIDAIESASGRRALILISDGTDRYSQTRSADLLDRVRRKDVLIYPVALGRTRDVTYLRRWRPLPVAGRFRWRMCRRCPRRCRRLLASCGFNTCWATYRPRRVRGRPGGDRFRFV